MNLYSILIVDDEEPMLRTFNRILSYHGLHIFTCTGPAHAIQVIKENQIDIIICDQALPGMVGLDFLEIARVISPNTVRILMSGFIDISQAEKMLADHSVHAMIEKPFSTQKILELIDRFLKIKNIFDRADGSPDCATYSNY